MFGLFKKKNPKSPLDTAASAWLENALMWLINEFNNIPIDQRKVLTPVPSDFPFNFGSTEESGKLAFHFVAETMEVNLENVVLHFFDNGIQEFDMGGSVIFTEQHKGRKTAAGLYYDLDNEGKSTVALDRKLLNEPEQLIATIAHELSHFKLLGEKRVDFNDEDLTDLTTVVFGFGIFNANSAFQFSQSYDRWSYSQIGYLSQIEWGYALALFSYLRQEYSPVWLKHLNRTIQSDFRKSMAYILANKDKLFSADPESGKSYI